MLSSVDLEEGDAAFPVDLVAGGMFEETLTQVPSETGAAFQVLETELTQVQHRQFRQFLDATKMLNY